MGKEVRGLRNTNGQLQNSHGNIKYSKRSRVAKECICMTHGHEQWWGGLPDRMRGGAWRAGVGGGESQDNYNSIINKI